jgi:cell division protein FtsQ
MTRDDDGGVRTRRPRWGRRLAAVGVLLALVSPWWAPPALRRLAFFRVRHVEVRDARFTPAEEVRTLLAIDTTFSIWEDLEPLRQRVVEHPQVRNARIARWFPSTLVVRLEEFQPVALVPTRDGMKAYDATGRVLPLDPSRTPVDAPLVSRPDTTLFRLLGEMQQVARDTYARLNEARRISRDVVLLDLVDFTVLVQPDIGVERLAQISSVEAELDSRRMRLRELDFRYTDQVIARIQ